MIEALQIADLAIGMIGLGVGLIAAAVVGMVVVWLYP